MSVLLCPMLLFAVYEEIMLCLAPWRCDGWVGVDKRGAVVGVVACYTTSDIRTLTNPSHNPCTSASTGSPHVDACSQQTVHRRPARPFNPTPSPASPLPLLLRLFSGSVEHNCRRATQIAAQQTTVGGKVGLIHIDGSGDTACNRPSTLQQQTFIKQR